MSNQYDIDSADNQRRRDLGLQVLSRIDFSPVSTETLVRVLSNHFPRQTLL